MSTPVRSRAAPTASERRACPRVRWVQRPCRAATPTSTAADTRSARPPSSSACRTTIYRRLNAALLPGEQTTPYGPWRIRLTDEDASPLQTPTFPRRVKLRGFEGR